MTPGEPPAGPVPRTPAWREYAEAILVAVLLSLFFRTFVFQLYEIPSPSMEPNLLPGDHIVVNKFVYGPHRGPWAALLPHRDLARGDVFVFRFPPDPARDFIKRAIGLPGETVSISRKRVSVNGTPLEEPYAVFRDPDVVSDEPEAPTSVRRRDEGRTEVPPDGAFAMGDNRDDSHDSRFWGPVPMSHLRGRAVLVFWSRNTDGDAVFRGRGAGLRRALDTALHFFKRTRWERTFRLVR